MSSKIANALASNPDAIDSQIRQHSEIVRNLLTRVETAERRADKAEHELAVLREQKNADEKTIEEVEVKRLALILGSLEEFVSHADDATLWTLYEQERFSDLAKLIHRAMRGHSGDLRNRCSQCGSAEHSVCYDASMSRFERKALDRKADEAVTL